MVQISPGPWFESRWRDLAFIAQMGERQTEDLKVASSILAEGTKFIYNKHKAAWRSGSVLVP